MALILNVQTTAILVIDMQNAFLDPKGSIAKMGIPIGRAAALIEPLAGALGRLRKSGAKIVHNRMALRPGYADAGILQRAFPRLKELGHCIKGTWDFENVQGFAPGPNEYVIDKIRFDGFHGTEMESLLRCMGIDTLVFTGIATNICVESTVRAAFTRDFRCIVPRQTTASFTPEMEAGSMGNFAFGFAEVVDIDEVYAALGC
jgi:ureidoacrylate peracid hydrolase